MTITPTAPRIPATGDGAPTAPRHPRRAAARRQPLAVVLALVGLGLVLAAAISVWGGSDDPGPTPTRPASADGTERWLASRDQPVRPASADGTERWLASLVEPAAPTTADAAERRAVAEQEALRTRCSGSSADAAERCVTSG
jgi:hypothetical protein